MSSKANASKKKSQQLKRNPKREIDEEAEISEKKVRNTVKKNKNHPKHLSSEGISFLCFVSAYLSQAISIYEKVLSILFINSA